MEELRKNDWKRNNPNPAIDMTGKRINMLTVLHRAESINGRTMWHCRCDCGKEFNVSYSHLKNGQYSCGCQKNRIISQKKKTHGMADTRLFSVWSHMKERCYKPYNKSFNDYGGRGIEVCEEWKNDFMCFYDWAIQNGYDENAPLMQCTIDRINVNGNYEPDNCRFITIKEQCNNRRNNRVLELFGESHTLAEWSEILNIKYSTIWRRLKNGWSVEEALNASSHIHKGYGTVCNIPQNYNRQSLVGEPNA